MRRPKGSGIVAAIPFQDVINIWEIYNEGKYSIDSICKDFGYRLNTMQRCQLIRRATDYIHTQLLLSRQNGSLDIITLKEKATYQASYKDLYIPEDVECVGKLKTNK